jgi:hypothetical protein
VEAVAAGAPLQFVWDMTYFEIWLLLEAKQRRQTAALQVALFGAWQTESMARHKRLPNLGDLLRKLEPVRVMSVKSMHVAVRQIAKAFGATVKREKRAPR